MVVLFHVSVTHVNTGTLKVATTNTSAESQKEKSAATFRRCQLLGLFSDGMQHGRHVRPQLQRSKHRLRQLRRQLAVPAAAVAVVEVMAVAVAVVVAVAVTGVQVQVQVQMGGLILTI